MEIKTEEEFLSKMDIVSIIKPINLSVFRNKLHFIYNYEYNRPIAYSSSMTAINSMFQRYSVNSYVIYNVNYQKNEYGENILPPDWNNTRGWEWKWDFKQKKYVHVPNELSWDEQYYFKMLFEKIICLEKINEAITRMRRPFTTDISFQHFIYQTKEKESRLFLQKLNNGESVDQKEFPFLTSHAEITGHDMEFAAREIIFQADIFNNAMLETEAIRIKHSQFILDCEMLSDFKGLMNSFYEEMVKQPKQKMRG